jgi:hypothetical protein
LVGAGLLDQTVSLEEYTNQLIKDNAVFKAAGLIGQQQGSNFKDNETTEDTTDKNPKKITDVASLEKEVVPSNLDTK